MLRICLCVFALATCLSVQALAQGAAPGSGPQAVKPSTVVNLNTATVAELEALPGIGAKVAARIVEYRTSKGPFRKIEDLMNVQGVGEKSFLKLKSRLTVTAPLRMRGNPAARHRMLDEPDQRRVAVDNRLQKNACRLMMTT
jgi:comEA protein